MPLGKHSSSEVTFTLTDAQGGTNRVLTGFLLSMGAAKISSILQKSTAYGDTFEKMLPTGIQKVDPITITGLWDDSATPSPHTVLLSPDILPNSAARALIITFSTGTVRTFTATCFLESYAVIGKTGGLTEFAATLVLVGSAAWT